MYKSSQKVGININFLQSKALPPINFGLWDYMKWLMAEHLEFKKKYGSLKISCHNLLATQAMDHKCELLDNK
eukprot:gene2334-2687_t